MASHQGPVTATERLQSLDILRGVALCGILLMNIMFMGGARTGHPFLPASTSDPDWIVGDGSEAKARRRKCDAGASAR